MLTQGWISKHHAKGKKLDTKDTELNYPVYMKFLETIAYR